MVKLQRLKPQKYEIRYEKYDGVVERVVFPAYNSKSKEDRIREVSDECYYWLLDGRCFSNGSLIVVPTEDQAEKVEEVREIEGYVENTHSIKDVEKLLKSSDKKLREELSKVTDLLEKQSIISMCKELKLDSYKKQQAIVEALYGEEVPVETIFEA